MVKPLPSRFNPDLMARDGTRYEAVVPLERFKRLGPILASTEGAVQASAGFSRRKDHIVVSGNLKVGMHVQCQRCLDAFSLSVDAQYELVFVETEGAASELSDDFDPVILDDTGQIHLIDLFEDELILQVPLVIRHPEGACESTTRSFGDVAPEATDPGDENRQRPFEALKNLNLH